MHCECKLKFAICVLEARLLFQRQSIGALPLVLLLRVIGMETDENGMLKDYFRLIKLVLIPGSFSGSPYAPFPSDMLFIRNAIFLPRLRMQSIPSSSSLASSPFAP